MPLLHQQHEEQIRAQKNSEETHSKKDFPGAAPVLGNAGGAYEPSGSHYDAGRSSQTIAVLPAGDDIKALVHRVFEVRWS
jgi:hypothetical protein